MMDFIANVIGVMMLIGTIGAFISQPILFVILVVAIVGMYLHYKD